MLKRKAEMSATCCGHQEKRGVTPQWRRALWIALAINAGMFATEIYAGAAADSRALMADALDFLADAATYLISLVVAGMALLWRARAALAKGVSLLVLGLIVLGSAIWAAFQGASPEPRVMGAIGLMALFANLVVAMLLYRFRDGDANMRSVWICTRNDAIGNVAVVAAALGVFGTGTMWPDLFVAAILAGLGLVGGWQIVREARAELRSISPKSAESVPLA